LDQLAPKYLKTIPTDYFASGAPFRYRRRGQDYDLWSVGPDKIDNAARQFWAATEKAAPIRAAASPRFCKTAPAITSLGKVADFSSCTLKLRPKYWRLPSKVGSDLR
jgi:hypothetical protein